MAWVRVSAYTQRILSHIQRILSHILRVECVEGSLHCSVERYFLLVFLFSPLHQKHCPMRESRTVLDSGFHAVDSGLYWIPVFVGRTWILHSNPIFVCGILHSLSVFRIPKVKFSQIPESGFLYTGRKSNISNSYSIWKVSQVIWKPGLWNFQGVNGSINYVSLVRDNAQWPKFSIGCHLALGIIWMD